MKLKASLIIKKSLKSNYNKLYKSKYTAVPTFMELLFFSFL
jgi:hypothetical protein